MNAFDRIVAVSVAIGHMIDRPPTLGVVRKSLGYPLFRDALDIGLAPDHRPIMHEPHFSCASSVDRSRGDSRIGIASQISVSLDNLIDHRSDRSRCWEFLTKHSEEFCCKLKIIHSS